MRRIGLTVLIVVVLLAPGAQAALTVLPEHAGNPAVGVSGDSAPGWGAGSWQGNGVNYSKLYLTPSVLFGREVTIGELSSISYYTKKDTTHTDDAADWFFQMYTDPYDGSPGSSWYGNRINAEPYFSENLNDPAGEWNQWTTDAGGDNRLRFYDSSSGYFGGYSDGFLSDLTSDSNYQDQYIKYIVVGTGSGWADGFEGQIDGLLIALTDESFAEVDFEATAIPEPATLIIWSLLGFLGIAASWYRKRRS